MTKKLQANGFTLIETVIVIALFTMVVLVMYGIFDQHNYIYNYEQGMIAVAGSARTSENDMLTYGLQAHRVLASATVNSNTYFSGTNSLVLQLPSINSNGQTLSNTWDYVAFYTSGSQLWEQVQADPTSARQSLSRLLSSSLFSINFTYDNVSYPSVQNVTANITTQNTVHNRTVQDNLIQKIHLRNY